MIIDKIDTIENYKSLSPRIEKAINYILQSDFKSMELGKYKIDGDEVFAIISEYDTKTLEAAKPETHKKYLDIQIIAEGAEFMGYLPLDGQATSVAYNPEKDVAFYTVKCNLVEVKEGMFTIFMPQDIHQPCVMIDESKKVRKVVVKVLV